MDQGAPKEVADHPLFSSEERRKIVQRFIEAYINGTVTISFPEEGLKKPEPETPEQKGIVVHVEQDSKTYFAGLVETACMTRTGPLEFPSALRAFTIGGAGVAIDKLFALIIAARQGERIKGQFFLQSPTFEAKIDRLEETMTKVTTALDGIKQWMEKYQPVLEEAEKDYGDKLGRVGEVERNE
jgi:hypothetical protein